MTLTALGNYMEIDVRVVLVGVEVLRLCIPNNVAQRCQVPQHTCFPWHRICTYIPLPMQLRFWRGSGLALQMNYERDVDRLG